ncbi:STAS-like domain-containing protein [Paraburkholderia sp. GAS348]|uniref:STAS-like domain-containing protein n=1 Tax=Paraburkholderia sp. GAS348 TaxID=3035132 RepID=UPI003D223504
MMTTSTFKICVHEHFRVSTRPNGVDARTYVLNALKDHDIVELDFQDAHPTPSFADECVGVLCATIGWEAFRQRVKLTNVSDDSRGLIKHVIVKRRTEHHAHA